MVLVEALEIMHAVLLQEVEEQALDLAEESLIMGEM